ncbi:MAG: FAD-binding protein [Candidatus Marinimicrobia bacterium]|nr:FAD-binding protein [Candidatus Neomarinimicrobiota bacterium]MBT5956645.1 FAD-binding protein [Candidatus Neomarinimicrobiota bacterium]MBT6870177.1 FAD-binding protein [Candidatus Neomarinimicrobiota bacterium]MBT7378084.1 FAD-binding protein [Candidatus Neomarinimicrobiota bacterium]
MLVIGTGLAGATAALTAADEGKKVTIITKTNELKSSNTPHIQGGIVYKGLDDSPEKLNFFWMRVPVIVGKLRAQELMVQID